MHQIKNVCVHLGPRSKKFLSEIDFVLISVWQFKLDELEIACLKDHWITLELGLVYLLKSDFKLV